uniref:U1-type domain-containing protein n=1 Tax=Strongyloides stercoralis TaxID=6248 RepID=A0AAF5CTE2_STRER
MSSTLTGPLPEYAVLKKNGLVECKICNKSDIREKLWISHVKGAEHKKSILKLKNSKKAGDKRPHGGVDGTVVKKLKNDEEGEEVINSTTNNDNNVSELPADFFEVSSAKPTLIISQNDGGTKNDEEEKAKRENFLANYDSIMEEFEEELKKDEINYKDVDEEIEEALERKDEDDIEEILGDAINTGTEEEMMRFWKEHEEVEKKIEESRREGDTQREEDNDNDNNWEEEDFKECDLFRGRMGFTQSSAAKGKLICEGKPASGVLVKLWDEDDLPGDSDDLLGSVKTNARGEFEVKGHTDEFTPIDVKLNIYHDCNDGLKPCQRKFTIKVPGSYITRAKTPTKVYDAGTIQLAGKYPGETRDCLH